jgi:chromosome segregation ATPase
LVRASIQFGAPGNEANGFGSGFTAIAEDLKQLGHEDLDLKRNISVEADNAAQLNLHKLRIRERLQEMEKEDEELHAEVNQSRRSIQVVEKKYEHALAVIKNKYEAEIKALLPRLHTCAKQRDQIASELNVASAELYMAQERLEEARLEVNSTKKNWTNLVAQLSDAVDADEQQIVELRANKSKIENDTHTANLVIRELKVEEKYLQEVLANASNQLESAKAEQEHLDAIIRDERRKGADLTKKSLEVTKHTKQLLQKIADRVHAEKSSNTISAAAKNASNVQKDQMKEFIAARKARIDVTHAETNEAKKQLQDATELLAKDRDLIARFQNQTVVVKADAKAECKSELAKVQDENGKRVAALRVALDQARHAEDEISKQNHQLMQEVEALKQQIASSLIQFTL